MFSQMTNTANIDFAKLRAAMACAVLANTNHSAATFITYSGLRGQTFELETLNGSARLAQVLPTERYYLPDFPGRYASDVSAERQARKYLAKRGAI